MTAVASMVGSSTGPTTRSQRSRLLESDECFPSRLRKVGVAYVALTLPLVTLVGGLADGQGQYIVAFVVGSGVYTTPALVLAATAIRRLPGSERWRARLWLAGLALVYSSGAAMLVGVATGWRVANGAGVVMVALITAVFTGSAAAVVRAHSGRRALSVDLVEWLMCAVVLGAPAVVLWGEAVVTAEDAWFTIPAGMAAIGTASGCYWTTVLYLRQGPDSRPFQMTLVRVGVALSLVGVTDAVLQTAHGVSDFTLPSWLLVGVHGLCMSLLLVIPLYFPSRRYGGLGHLPPQAQVRGVSLAAMGTLVGLPVLALVTLAQRDQHRWVSGFAFGVVVFLLVLATLRLLAGDRETRRLYSLVEQASAARRDLLAHVIQRIDDDRHAVAAQLHEQAIAAYATFVSFVQATAPSRVGQSRPARDDDAIRGRVDGASALVRDDLARQAEALRQLMLAIRPMGADRPRIESVGTLVQAYLDSLYGDRQRPELDVEVDPALDLDWITQTIVFRIVQEALHNVWRHSEAAKVRVVLRPEGDGTQVVVADDGIGFVPDALLFESGLDAMRSFAAFANGALTIESAPGVGTIVVASLGDSRTVPARDEEPPEPARPPLRLV